MNPRTGLAKQITSNLRKVTDIKIANKNAAELETQTSLTDVELLEIGLSKLEEENFKLAIPYCEDALKKTSSPLVAAECQYVITVSYQQLNKDKTLVLENYILAYTKCDEGKDLDQNEYIRIKSKIFRHLGLYFLSNNKLPQAATYFKKSLDLAKQSPTELKGFIPAITAYYALALCKQGDYNEGFKLFDEAKVLYDQFSSDELNVSLDYASYYVHLGRVYIQQNEFEKAIQVLEIGHALRIKNLKAETQNETNIYNENRIGAVLTLLNEAKAKLAEQKPLKTTLTFLQTGNSLHSTPSDFIVNGRELSSFQKRKIQESNLNKGIYVFFDDEKLVCSSENLDYFQLLVINYCFNTRSKGAVEYIQNKKNKCVYGQLGMTNANTDLLENLKSKQLGFVNEQLKQYYS